MWKTRGIMFLILKKNLDNSKYLYLHFNKNITTKMRENKVLAIYNVSVKDRKMGLFWVIMDTFSNILI